MLRRMPAFLLLFACLQHPDGAVSTKTNDAVVEIISDTSLMGIREVTRVTSLENCLHLCQQCAGLVYYPDNACIIFNKLDRLVLSSFGATCCFAVENHQEMKCTRCDDENQSDKDETEGATNILNVWTRNPQTNSSYKVIPYDCQQTPYTYEGLCEKESGHLASIHSQQEDSFISALGIRSCHCKHIGLYSAPSQPDSFHWRDGTPVNYLNWKVGEPYGAGPRCAYIWQASGWVSGKCTETHGGCCAVCQKNN